MKFKRSIYILMSVVIVYIFGTLSSCKDPGVLIPYSGDPLTDYVETPGFIIELGGDPVKMQLLASKRMTGATGYHERLILDLGTGQGNEGNPKLTGRYFVPIIYPNTAEHQFTIRIWYDQPLGAGRWIKIFSKYNLSEPEAEYSMYSTTNVIYGDFFDRQTNPPHWQLNQSYMGPRYWAVDLNPFRFTLSPDVHTSGNMIENNENAVTASPRIYATVTGGARAIKILADGKQIYKYDIIPEGDANGTFLTNLPENFSFFLPLDLDWLNQKDLVVQAVYPDTTSEVILSGNRSITLFNQLGDQLGKLVLPMDYNPFIKPEMLELYDYETHTLKFKIINAGNQSYKAGIGLSKNLVPLSVTFPTEVTVAEASTRVTPILTNRSPTSSSFQNEGMNYQILKNPGNLFTIENSPNGERFLSFNSPSAYNPGNNQFDVGIVSYDGFGFVRWNIVKVTVSPDSLRDLPRVSFENQNIERNEEDGSVINMTVQFNKPLTQAARIPVKLKDLGGDYEHHSGLTNINLSTKTGILEMAAGSQEKTFKLTLNDDSAWINGSETVRIDILAPPTDQGIIWRRSLPAEHDGSFVNLKIIDNDKPKLRLYFPDHYPTTYREDSLASGSARQYDPPAFPLIAHAGLSLGAENVENGGVTKLPDEFEVYLSITPTDRTAYFNGIKDNWFYTVKYYQNGFNSDYWPLKVEISSNGIFSGQVFEKRELYSNGRYGDGTYTNGVLPVALYLNEISADTGITLSLEPQDHYELSGDSQLELQGINVD